MRFQFEKFCNSALIFTASAFLIFLTIMSFFFSQRFGREEWGEIVNGACIYQVTNNLFLQMAGLVLLSGLFMLLFRLQDKIKPKVLFFFQIAAALASGVLAFLLLSGGTRAPYGDQAQVYNAAMFFNNGNYISLSKGGYLDMYPQQLGYVAYVQLILRLFGNENFYAVQLINCLWITGFCGVYCLCLNELTQNNATRFVGSLGIFFFFPLFWLVSWVYGDVPCLFFTILLYFCYLKYLRRRTGKWLAFMIVLMCLCLVFRKNSLVIMTAMAISLLFLWLREKRASLIITAALLVILPLGTVKGIETYYAKVSGYSIDGGLPNIMWIAMGTSEDASKPGWFNNFGVPIYYAVNYDRKAASEQAEERIRNRFALYAEDPVYAVSFYKRKICTQWNDPFYNTNALLQTDSKSRGLTKILQLAEDGFLFPFFSAYQFLFYCGALLYCCKTARRKRVHDNFIIILFVGGMLFSILWEANSRYVFPYVILLMLLSVIGWEGIFTHEPKSIKNFRI